MRSSEQITVGVLAIKLITHPGGLFDSRALRKVYGKELADHGMRPGLKCWSRFKSCETVAIRWAHNLKVGGSRPHPATLDKKAPFQVLFSFNHCLEWLSVTFHSRY